MENKKPKIKAITMRGNRFAANQQLLVKGKTYKCGDGHLLSEDDALLMVGRNFAVASTDVADKLVKGKDGTWHLPYEKAAAEKAAAEKAAAEKAAAEKAAAEKAAAAKAGK